MKNIRIIEMGGTISAHGNNRMDGKDYVSGAYDGIDFMHHIPELNHIANIRFETFLQVSSTAITVENWLTLREKIMDYVSEDTCDGIVITHGTNTIEETAYFLHLTIPTEKPIVIVGAQRPFTALSTDAHMNLVHATILASSKAAYGKGVLVVLNNQISSAREVTKTNTYHLQTFQNGDAGFLGYVDADGSVVFYRKPTRKHTIHSAFAKVPLHHLPNVAITYSYAGADAYIIDSLVDSNMYDGIVTAGTGAGLLSPLEIEALERAVHKNIVVMRSSRVGNGRVVPIAPYAGKGFLCADNLLPQKARILLMLALATNRHDPEKIQEYFHTY